MSRHLLRLLITLITFSTGSVSLAADSSFEVVSVSTQPLKELVVQAVHEAPASARSLNESRLSAEVTAVIESIPVQVGMVIDAGTLLVQLDQRDYALAQQQAVAALESVQARIKQAEFQLKRARELFTKKFASEDTLIQRQTELSVLKAELAGAQAQLDSARRNLEKCRVTAPFRAIVLEREANVGEFAVPGSPLMQLIDVTHIEVTAQVQPKDGPLLESAESVKFVAPRREYPVKLLRLSPAVDRTGRTREARLAFIAESAPPGTEGRLVWQSTQPQLPADLISQRNGQLGVFIAEQDKARFVILEQAQEGRPVPVELSPETLIIVEGRFGLQNGQGIKLKP